jgi:hypothetical protein
MAKSKGNSRLKAAEAAVQSSVETIDEQIEELQKFLTPYEKIKGEIDKLKAARRALLGGSRLTGEGSTKLRMEDVTQFLRENPGSTPGVIAEHFKVPQTTVSSHLYRGKGERYISKDGAWYLRDPKNGINTEEDV